MAVDRFVSFLNKIKNFRLVEKGFDGNEKLNAYYRLPTLSIFKRKEELIEKETDLVNEEIIVLDEDVTNLE
jgi:hypothetical protein